MASVATSVTAASAPAGRLVIKPRLSIIMLSLQLIVHAGALLSLLLLGLPGVMVVALAILLLLHLLFVLARLDGMPTAWAISTLTWREDATWSVALGDHSQHPAQLLPGMYLTPWLVVLRFSLSPTQSPTQSPTLSAPRSATLLLVHNRKRTLVLFRDSVEAECLRALRVRLLTCQPQPST